jgi:chromosomal replication initiator protein|tara:strand:- start:8703 stop:10184 length:1482 start_codon:yes stop_codon:yes gene_type:complete
VARKTVKRNADEVWDADEVWEQCAAGIRSQVSDIVYQMTFSSIQTAGVEGTEIVLTVPSSVLRDRIESRYRNIIEETIAEATDDHLCPRIEVREASGPDDEFLEQPLIDPLLIQPASEETIGSTPLDDPHLSENGHLDTSLETDPPEVITQTQPVRCTFDDFVIGTSNRFAHAAALAVAGQPAKHYNPLFIYGAAGLGKTHLLRAVANYVTDQYPNLRVRYVSSEEFLNHFVGAIQNRTQAEFKQRYREVDVLLVDDVQFLAGKEGLQEEFFHTFNSIHQAGGQILLSSDRPPDKINTLEDRLRSRFKMGLTTDIQPPDFETRLAILRKKGEEATNLNLLTPEVLDFIAENITNNIRELEGALTRITAWANLNQVTATEEEARKVLKDLITSNKPRPITAEVILRQTSELYGFAVVDLIGPSRRRPLVQARQIAMYVFRDLTDLSFPAIGREFSDRDHTTVIHAVDKIKSLMGSRQEIYDQVTDLIAAIKTGD